MLLNRGDYVCSKDCNGNDVEGRVVTFLERTVIIESRENHYLVKKEQLRKIGYSFPTYKKGKYYQISEDKNS